MRITKGILAPTLLLIFSLCLVATPAAAHPMGNFSVSHYAKLTVDGQSVTILYLLDLAEIPTYQDIRQFSLTPQRTPEPPEPVGAGKISMERGVSQSPPRCECGFGRPSPSSSRFLNRTTEPGVRLRAVILIRPVPVST